MRPTTILLAALLACLLAAPSVPAADSEQPDYQVFGRRVPEDIDIPDETAERVDSDNYSAPGNLISSLPPSTSQPLTAADLAKLTTRQIEDMLAAIQGAGFSPATQANLALLQKELADRQRTRTTAPGQGTDGTTTIGGNQPVTVAAGDPNGIPSDVSLADVRARDIERSMGGGAVVGLLDLSLRNLTDFFTAEDLEDGARDTAKAYSTLTGQAVDKGDLSFEDELAQNGGDEAVTRRGVDQR